MVNSVNFFKACFTAKPPPVNRSVVFETCINHLLHEPYSQ
jgi:hypothetical protein